MKKEFNFVFFGTPEVASETLEILKTNGYLPSLIITAPDKPKGRKMIITPPPVKIWAEENKIPYIQPEKITPSVFGTSHLLSGRLGGGLDFFLVVAYGKILPEEIINLPKLGSINVHYSLLPKYRGASPVESVILNNEKETGVSIQKMELRMDAGAILAQEKTKITPDENAPELRKRLIKMGGELLVKILTDFAFGKIGPVSQNETQATFCKKIKKTDGLVNLGEELPSVLYNKFRAYAEWPRIYFMHNNKRIIITNAILENNEFKIKKVIPEGKREISWEEFQRSTFSTS